jgi:single-strand DNA-binding protein
MLTDFIRLKTESGFGLVVTLQHQTIRKQSKNKTIMETFNKVEIQGFLGQDADVKTFEGGRTLINLNVATSESYKNQKGEWVTTTTWHRVSQWRTKTDEKLTSALKKGALVLVHGKLNTRKYTDKSGQERYLTEIVAQKIEPVKEEAPV